MAEDGFVDISAEQDGGLLKKVLVEGSSDETPTPGSNVSVHYVGTLLSDGSKFDSSRDRPGTFKFDVGVGNVIKGWDVGICTMKKGEKSILRCRHDFAYGEHGSPPKIPPEATLNFEVELFSWKEKLKEPYEMILKERIEFAMKMKDKGTDAFKKQDWASAVEAYDEGQRYITFGQGSESGGHGQGHSHAHSHSHGDEPCSGHGDEEEETEAGLSEEDKKLAIALLTNCAMARLKAGEPELAKFDCTKALEFDADNVKAYFRRASAKLALGELDAAKEDAQKAFELDPTNTEAEALMKKADLRKKQLKQKEKDMCSKMFG
mmetsp:Transcript_156387/g.501703  ORF Transcript_156387/g.501703 Transcript_156387/m.501703 type:complete len:320 (-) Transcript_156387:58-1017(-)|eukprot:CAMPEP_0203968912 /NCGR_PEP_ID=MMETSP0359-20131031/97191_1 /ASSEMBLY_ACC=CAM_ASM_000338 /TAXON_ID=268821 /ORGANISM="Scrippsiella Hangoei, Strain SHTV-5" /LENGTH=319 /DNA_ID=CAMNT_0050906843 /DNA_START=78 /DNA_END=1037 /DNA_ORIENTATION=-